MFVKFKYKNKMVVDIVEEPKLFIFFNINFIFYLYFQ